MSRDVLTIGSTMRILLLYQGEYLQWVERFMNYLEEQTDEEAMINSIKNEKSMWSDQEKKIQKVDRLARSLLIQRLPNDIYSLIDSNKTAKDLWDALARHMLGSEYDEQDRKAAVLYEYETFKANEGELLLDTYIRYLQVINDLKKCGYSKDNCELNFKFLNNLQPEWKQYATMMRQNKNLMDINIDDLYNILKQNQGDVNDAIGLKKKNVVVTSDPLALIAEKTKVNKSKEKKDKDEQVLLAEDQAWMESSSDSDQEINANMVFMGQIEIVLSDSQASSSSADEMIYEVSYYLFESESESEYETSEYYDNTTIYVVDHNDSEGVDKLIRKFNKKTVKCQKRIEKANQQKKDFENQNKDLQDKYDVLKNQATTFEMNNKELNEQLKVLIEENDDLLDQTKVLKDQLQVKHVVIDTHVEFELEKHVRDLKNTVLEKDYKISELEEYVRNKDLEIEKCLERLNVCENKLHKMHQTNQTVHMIMPSKDILYNGRKGIGFENPKYFKKAKDLRPSSYNEKVIGLGYTLMFLTHSDEALEIEKFKSARENKIKFGYDYENLNTSYVNEKINFSDDYFQEIINPDFEKIDSPFQQTSSLKPYVPNVILEKIIIDLEDEVVSLLEKEKANLKTIESLKSKGFESSENAIYESKNQSKNDCHVVEKECDKVENSKEIAPGIFNDSKVNKDVKRYSRKDLLSCNNSHLGETSSAYVCNDDMNVFCNSRMCDLFDENNLFIFDDESLRISSVSKIPFRKKPRDSLNVHSKRNSNQSLPRTVHRRLPKMQPLAEPIAKWFPRVERLLKMKFEKDHLCSACEQGKIHQKHHKSKTAFASNKTLYLLHMDLCGPMRVESINGKRYVLVVVDDYSRYTWVFFLHSKDEASKVIIYFIKKTQVNIQLQVQRVRTDNGTEFKNKTLAKFFDEIMKSSTTNVETSINEEVFHEVSESFQG
uniref:Retrotransposon protein Ty1-copia subclass n=1 Tax=Tanacetum cinerariifolium TaxID=118510 RepID=A0A6L2NC69_TANCI|nr:retrotransposon protein Ty1-copia subclass [Tanacetum cinerariifolium]